MKYRAVLLSLLGALALSSCTLVSPNSAPSRVKTVPFSLLSPTIPGTNHLRVRFITQPVYIVDAAGDLAPSSRIVPEPPALATVIEQLLLGPTTIEKSAGYTSALPKSLVVISAKISGATGIGVIDFASSLNKLPPPQQLLAIGQLVLTAYVVGAKRGLEIRVAGVTQNVLLPNGKHATLVTAGDFQSLLNA